MLGFNSLYFIVIAIIATHLGAVGPPMHKDTEDDWDGLKQAKAECAYIVVRSIFHKPMHERNVDGMVCDGRGFIQAVAEAVEGVPREAEVVVGSLLLSSLRICTHRTGSDS